LKEDMNEKHAVPRVTRGGEHAAPGEWRFRL